MKIKTQTLGGWRSTLKSTARRSLALKSRPKSWSLNKKYSSIARALAVKAVLSSNYRVSKSAKSDSKYFFDKIRK